MTVVLIIGNILLSGFGFLGTLVSFANKDNSKWFFSVLCLLGTFNVLEIIGI